MILAGDIGVTHTRLAFFEIVDGHFELLVYDRFPSRGYANLEDIVRVFVSAHNLGGPGADRLRRCDHPYLDRWRRLAGISGRQGTARGCLSKRWLIS